ncbi:Glutamate-rich WD repeat-containing protein 1 [Scheffersomyces spartinae]|uniref:Glutamate-rich WD repeat-containing protein 1 n=1 Tax=Scheffersomyces spartinae TaxID=45513 RepID=A0A9P7VBA3_9ASCO|nr:Glutamate-rich WD repeat-containing protein 1 [Scheffersomyces spartinae]KAG7194843.1 Glutamate-rich WD repeat-containing protein 1 [Scheffersomyces spartinae]
MSKRSASEDLDHGSGLGAAKHQNGTVPPVSGSVVDGEANDTEMGEFEDPYGDEFESDGEIIELDGDDDEDDDGIEVDEETQQNKAQAILAQDAQQEQLDESTIYLPHRSKPLGPDEVLEADPTVYEMLHNVNLPWPCLTVDVLPDSLGSERRTYPASVYLTTATQASKNKDNELITMKLSSLAKTLVKDDDEDEDEDEEEDGDDSDPIMDSETIPLKHTTNRIRVSPHSQETGEYLTATMSESGEVFIYDLGPQVKAFDTPGYVIPKTSKRPIHTIRNHGNVEGYGLDWSPITQTGALLSGDCSGRIHLTSRTTSSWVTDKTPFSASQASIEDIQWSTGEATVFATGGTDGYVRIWDTRSKKHKPAISVVASKSDVNVISWCSRINHLLASGHDDGTWGVWDLRSFGQGQAPSPVAHYEFHKSPITSISFNPLDESIIAVSSEDNTVTLWDLAVEADDEEIANQRKEIKELNDIPPQLLFVHWQKDVKDVRWHKQIPGCLVSTGGEGLNVWKTISV